MRFYAQFDFEPPRISWAGVATFITIAEVTIPFAKWLLHLILAHHAAVGK